MAQVQELEVSFETEEGEDDVDLPDADEDYMDDPELDDEKRESECCRLWSAFP